MENVKARPKVCSYSVQQPGDLCPAIIPTKTSRANLLSKKVKHQKCNRACPFFIPKNGYDYTQRQQGAKPGKWCIQ